MLVNGPVGHIHTDTPGAPEGILAVNLLSMRPIDSYDEFTRAKSLNEAYAGLKTLAREVGEMGSVQEGGSILRTFIDSTAKHFKLDPDLLLEHVGRTVKQDTPVGDQLLSMLVDLRKGGEVREMLSEAKASENEVATAIKLADAVDVQPKDKRGPALKALLEFTEKSNKRADIDAALMKRAGTRTPGVHVGKDGWFPVGHTKYDRALNDIAAKAMKDSEDWSKVDEQVIVRPTGPKFDVTTNKRSIAGQLESLIGKMESLDFGTIKKEFARIIDSEETHASDKTRAKWRAALANTLSKYALMRMLTSLYLAGANMGTGDL